MVTRVNPTQTTFAEDFRSIDLADVPDAYGNVGDVLVVNAGGDGLEFAAQSGGGGSATFAGLTDTDPLGAVGQMVVVDPTGTKLTFQDQPTIPPARPTLADLDDVGSYAGREGQILVVAEGATEVEWVDPQELDIQGTFEGLQNTPASILAEDDGKFLVVDGNNDEILFVDQATAIDPALIPVSQLQGFPVLQAGQFLRVAANGTDLEFAAVAPSQTFADLVDTPTLGTLQTNEGYTLVAQGGGVGLAAPVVPRDSFTSLTDTPNSLAGNADKLVAVNPGGTALALVDPPAEPLMVAVGASEATITAGTDRETFRMPRGMNLGSIKASVSTAPTGTLTVDVNRNGVSILSTEIQIENGETTSKDAAVQPVLVTDVVVLAEDDEITIDVDSVVGSPTGLKVTLIPA